jgi:hypothetical protein
MKMRKEKIEGKGKVYLTPAFKEFHLRRGGCDCQVTSASCPAWRRLCLQLDVVHVTALRGGNHQPHLMGHMMEG